MGRPSINSIHKTATDKLSVVDRFLNKAVSLPPELYGFVSEVMMLRIFATIEYAVRETATRLACGCTYRNGIAPSHIIYTCSNLTDAINQFKTYGRGKPRTNLQFTNVKNTNDSIKLVIDSAEPFRTKLTVYGVIFEEMRKIRNHIAHRTSSTYKDYKSVITSRYGGFINLKPGVLLTSIKRHPRPIVREYLDTARIMIDEITIA